MYKIAVLMLVVASALASSVNADTCKPLRRSPLLEGLAEKYREKTWLFALEGSWEPYTYLNAETGQLKGFLLDLIYEACLRCDMKCDTIYIGENIQSCFNPMNYTAEGLFNRYFDGCVGWGPTALRKNVLAFSSPLTKAPLARLYTRATSGITRPDQAVAGKTVGFRAFWFTDKLCARYNLLPQLRDEDVRNIEVTNGWEDLLTQLVQRDVDLILLPDGYKGTEDLVAVGDAFSCTEGPLSLMHRKDVDLSWFGKCVQDLYRVDRYRTLCTNWDVKTLSIDFLDEPTTTTQPSKQHSTLQKTLNIHLIISIRLCCMSIIFEFTTLNNDHQNYMD